MWSGKNTNIMIDIWNPQEGGGGSYQSIGVSGQWGSGASSHWLHNYSLQIWLNRAPYPQELDVSYFTHHLFLGLHKCVISH